MILAIIGVIIGFVLLVKGADFFVEGSGSVAKKFNVPVFIIGMTIVAMGTSLPETAVSVSAMWKVSFWLCFLQYFCMVWFGLPEIREKPENWLRRKKSKIFRYGNVLSLLAEVW